jgi:beta-mannosidase
VDSAGRPKAAWYHLRRACSLIALHISDEGGNGLALHVANDTPYALDCRLEIALWRADGVNVGRGSLAVRLAVQGSIEVNAAALLDGFYDLSYAYKFGPPAQDLVSVRLIAPDDALIATAFHVIGRLPVVRDAELGLTARATRATDGRWTLIISARRFAQYVRCEVPGFICVDNHFHLAPGEERSIPLAPIDAKAPPPTLVGEVTALNALAAVPIVVV